MAKNIISQPLLKTAYIDNHNGDKVLYLEVPKKISRSMIVNEVEGNGKHFESTLKYIDKEGRSRMVLISAFTQEAGLMAVSYIAGALGENYQPFQSCLEEDCCYSNAQSIRPKQYFVDEDEEMFLGDIPKEEWIEQRGLIPVIHASDVACFYANGYTGVDFGMTLRTGQNERRDNVPYWTKCRKEAVCILLDDYMTRQEIDILNRFATNKRVYVVYAPRTSDALVEAEVMGLPFSCGMAEMNELKNKAVLYHGMDEIHVSLSQENKWKYYGDVAKQAFRDHDIVNTASIPYDRIVAVAEGIASSSMCTAINKIVEYALKDYSEGLIRRLKKADFEFLNSFEKRKTLGTKTASDKLKNEIVGLGEIKNQVNQIVNVMKLNKLRTDMGLQGEKYHNVHVMLGAPGTAKTTVAKLMGEIMTEESLLPGKRTIVVNGAMLKGEYVGQSAPKTHAMFEYHDIIIIDEAYSMVDTTGGTDSFSNEAIAQLVIELENHATDKLVIFAGYGGKDVCKENNKMQLFLNANPGIQSRISSTFYFPSYTPEEMVNVFMGIAERNRYTVEKDAIIYVKEYFASRVGAKDFGNGREARNLVDACTLFLADRIMTKNIMQISKEDLMDISVQDVKKAVKYLQESYAIQNDIKKTEIGFG